MTQTLALQINGRTRGTLEVPATASRADIDRLAAQTVSEPVVRTVLVPGKLIGVFTE